MSMTPAYAMNTDNARVDTRACDCGETFKAAHTDRRSKCTACYKEAGEKHCRRCAGTGQFITGSTNGIPTGPGGDCFRCGGKGYQTPKDQRRNDCYDRHRPVHL